MFSFIFIESPWGTATVVNIVTAAILPTWLRSSQLVKLTLRTLKQCQSFSATVLKIPAPKVPGPYKSASP